MDGLLDDLRGISNPSSWGEKISKLKSEVLDLKTLEPYLKALREIQQLKERTESRRLKKDIAKYVLFGSMGILSILLVLGHFGDNNFTAAEIWWAAIGPLDGYLLRVVFGGKNG